MGVSYRDERRAGTQERSDEKGIKLHMIRFIIVQCGKANIFILADINTGF